MRDGVKPNALMRNSVHGSQAYIHNYDDGFLLCFIAVTRSWIASQDFNATPVNISIRTSNIFTGQKEFSKSCACFTTTRLSITHAPRCDINCRVIKFERHARQPRVTSQTSSRKRSEVSALRLMLFDGSKMSESYHHQHEK